MSRSLSWHGQGSLGSGRAACCSLRHTGSHRPPSDVPASTVTLQARHTSKGHSGRLSCPRSDSRERAGPLAVAGAGRGGTNHLSAPTGCRQEATAALDAVLWLAGQRPRDQPGHHRVLWVNWGKAGDPDGWGCGGAGGSSACHFGFCREGRPSTSYKWDSPVTAQHGPCPVPPLPAAAGGGAGMHGCQGNQRVREEARTRESPGSHF